MGVGNAIIRKRFMRNLQVLKKRNLNFLKGRALDDLDDYVMFLESHRIKLVAKLKAAFDKIDDTKEGEITGQRVQQLLQYLNRSTSSPDVTTYFILHNYISMFYLIYTCIFI